MTRRARPAGPVDGLAGLERALGHDFKDPALAAQALTHRSFGTPNNERLEFLGDALLNCSVAILLYERFPAMPEGDLSRLRAALVNQSSLSDVAARLALGDLLRLGEGELKSGGFRRPSILADALEALLGAIYLDAGFEAARSVVARLLAERLEGAAEIAAAKDPKTALQELLQGRRLALPRYEVLETRGEAHEQTFVVECTVEALGLATKGQGASRRAAEQAGAQEMIKAIEAKGVRREKKP